MKKLAIPLAILFLHTCALGQSNWQRVTTGISSSAVVNSVTASGQLALGSVTGDFSLNQTVRSTDGGQNWSTALTQPALKLKALSSSFIYGVRGDSIMTSADGGINWGAVRPVSGTPVVDVQYLDANQAFAVWNSSDGDTGYAAATTNDWAAHSKFPLAESISVLSIKFVNNQSGFVLARSIKSADSNAAFIFRTTNGGGLWNKQGALPDTCSPPSTLVLAADFVDASTGWAVQTCGTSATIYKTTDAGVNWAADTTLLVFQAFAIDAVNLQNAWVAGRSGVNGAIVRTSNGGTDWIAEAVPSNPGVLLSISMLDAAHGFASGQSATLLRYVPGTTGVDDGISNRPKTFDLFQNFPNPFNAGTRISFELKKREKVKLTVYNILGEAVAALYEGELPAGRHEFGWNGTDRRGKNLSTGLYLYELRTSEERQVRKMILLK